MVLIKIKILKKQSQWHMAITPAVGRLCQEDLEFNVKK
jgi:hypothetical protein